MTMSDAVRSAEKAVEDTRAALTEAESAYNEAQFNLWRAVGSEPGMPIEAGWYVDDQDNPWRLDSEGIWDDGWGNSGPMYGYPSPPLRRMTVVE